ncbi:MAG: threonine/serine dehydratase [Acidimicrobiales bacterium]
MASAPADRLRGHVRRTPVIEVAAADVGVGRAVSLHLKLEYLQYSGTFKARGATNFMLTNTIADAGVVAASGGNHGVAVAWAARRHGHSASVFVPTISAPAKVDRLRALGADVHQVGDVYSDALAASIEFQERTGATPIHAYDHPDVMAGAGTTGSEFAEQVEGLDTIVVACGGGGLSGGVAAAVPSVRLVVAETFSTNAFAAALEAGEPVDVSVSGIAADALGATRIGGLAWESLRAADALSVLVSDEQVVAAKQHLWDELRIVVEPSAATTIAALMSGAYIPGPSERVGVLLCGANTSIT